MFGFSHQDREIYKSTFLRKVVISIKFTPVPQLKEISTEISEIFNTLFTRIAFGKTKGMQISFGDEKSKPNLTHLEDDDNITLKTEDGQAELLINCDKITFSIEGRSYKSYEENVRNIVAKLLDFFELAGVKVIESYELRKINLIEFTVANDRFPNGILNVLLNKALVSSDDSFPGEGYISQNIHTVEFQDGNYRLNLKYGMNTLPIPDKKVGQLLVDYNIQSNLSIDTKSLSKEINTLNNELFNVFIWIFNDQAKSMLKNGEFQ